jgi:uncharacterized membrane protein YhhN
VAVVDTMLAAGPPRWRQWRRVSKPLLMPLLATQLTGRRDRPGITMTGTALLCSWVGDVVLLKRGRGPFLSGLSSFLLAHAAYMAAFWSRSTEPVLASPGRRRFLATSSVATVGLAAAAWRRERVLALPVAAYGGALTSMVAAAAAVEPDQGRARVLAGGVLFLVSDGLLGLRTFVVREDHPALEAAVMASYTAAQWCICDGMVRRQGVRRVQG